MILDHIKGQPQNWRYNFDTTMNNLKQSKNDQTIKSDRTIQTDSSRISSCDMGDYIGSGPVETVWSKHHPVDSSSPVGEESWWKGKRASPAVSSQIHTKV
jgi:hypothetical protein